MVSQNWGYVFWGPFNKDCSILGSMLGPLVLGNYHFGRVMPLGTAARVELSQGSIQVSAALGQDLGCESYSYYYVL